MKAILIVPYFGKLPTYFDLFLKSCSFNPDFNWIFFTDDQSSYQYPENTKCVITTFDEIKNLFKAKLGQDIVLIRPHKLCDYKVTYGYVFQDWIKDYDFWGHCDIDVIYGKLNNFITPFLLENYDKIFGLGHFSLYRNTIEINTIFRTPIYSQRVDLLAFNSDYGYAFDEWHCSFGGINQIFENSQFRFYKDNLCANLDSSSYVFYLSSYNHEKKKYISDKFHNHLFTWKNGILTRHFFKNGNIKTQEYPYIHFHKRSMKSWISSNELEFLIIPNKFIQIPKTGINSFIIRKYSRKPLLNFQFLKVKYISLRYRIRLLINNQNPFN